jgi:hypothetical protein
MTELDAIVKQYWRTWILNDECPWRHDLFLAGRMPVAVSVRYGQNIPICEPGKHDEELQMWEQSRRWGMLRFVSIALATHIRYLTHVLDPR